jgi:hypothetical protein
MSGTPLFAEVVAKCPHGGNIQGQPGSARVLIDKQPVFKSDDQFAVTACPFVLMTEPHPCVVVQPMAATARRVLIEGKPALLNASSGLCKSADQQPQGPPLITVCQTRVRGE